MGSTGALKVRMMSADWQNSAGSFDWPQGAESDAPTTTSTPADSATEACSNPSNKDYNNEWLASRYSSQACQSVPWPYLANPGAHEVAQACAHAYAQEQASESGQRISCAS